MLVEHLGHLLNSSLKYSIKNTWGYKNNESEWSGMIGQLQRNEADIGGPFSIHFNCISSRSLSVSGTPLFFTKDRVSVIEYIAMTTPTRSKFVFRKPKLSYVTNVYTLPFHWTVWTSSFALILLAIVLLYFVVKWEWYQRKFDFLTVG